MYTEALAAGEQRFKILADTAPMLLWMTGTDGNAEFVNSEYQKFTTYLLRTANPSEQMLMEGLQAIERNVRIQTQLIDGLLDIPRIVAGQLRLERKLWISTRLFVWH